MIHTFELSKELSKDTFEQMIHQYKMRWDKSSFSTTQFAEKGLPMVRLRKEPDKSNKNYKHYMIYLSVNTGSMFGSDPHIASNINSFSPDFVEAVYQRIFDAIPCLEEYPETRTAMHWEARLISGQDIHYEKWKRLKKVWLTQNAFKASRIDYTFDLAYHPHEYDTLLKLGYPVRHRDYCHINIYNKAKELQDKSLPFDQNTNYDFLRIEVQANKGKLESLLKKMKDSKISVYAESQARELQYLISPEVEEDILTFYVEQITGTGVYVPQSVAIDTINSSGYSDDKKDKLKKVIDEVRKCSGIANLLELVENGTITELGRPRTVEQYLRDIHALGINPVTLPSGMNVPNFALKNGSINGTAPTTVQLLPSLLDFIKSYCEDAKEENRNGVTVTEEDVKAILEA